MENLEILAKTTFGWEAWTRTRIARSRVWSPTNWTTSQQEEQKRIAAHSR